MKLQVPHGRLALRLAALVTFAGVFNVPALAANAALLPREHVDFQADFETTNALHGWNGPARVETGHGGGRALTVESKPGGAPSASLVSVALPVEAMRGCLVRGSAMTRAENVRSKPSSWNGIKCRVAIENTSTESISRCPSRRRWAR